MKKILFAVDGSDSCNMATKQVVDLAESINADLTILTVVEEVIEAHATTIEGVKNEVVAKKVRQGEAHNITLSCAENFNDNTVNINQLVKQGTPSEVICNVAVEGDYDLVVLADMGRNAIKKFFLGSTTERVVRYCKKSVLVVKQGY